MNPAVMGIATAASIALLGVTINDLSSTKYWYDYYHTYFVYDSQYTSVIDDILMNNDGNYSKVGPKKVISGTQKIPGPGYHYYYLFSSEHRMFPSTAWLEYKTYYIGMEKVSPEKGDPAYYIVWVPYTESGTKTLIDFEDNILKPSNDEIRVISIDTSQEKPSLEWLTKICRQPYNRKKMAIDFIMNEYTEKNNFNVKVFIHGERGLGKTYTTMLLKKELDKRYPNTNSRLYDDFDPTATGVNIQTLSLKYSSKISPVIIVIDEIDTIYEYVFKDTNDFDPRLKHAKDRNTFHKMLDNFGNFHHVITIFTSEFSPEILVERNPLFKSFLRPGRVDIVLNMDLDNCIKDTDYWNRIK